MLKLVSLTQEMCTMQGASPTAVTELVARTSENIEKALHRMFVEAREHGYGRRAYAANGRRSGSASGARRSDAEQMRACADTLYAFKSYSQCVDTFLGMQPLFHGGKVLCPPADGNFEPLFTQMEAAYNAEVRIVRAVFRHAEPVMARWIRRLFEQRVSQLAEDVLRADDALDDGSYTYLCHLHQMYQLSTRLLKSLTSQGSGVEVDAGAEPPLLQSVFGHYLNVYRERELAFIRTHHAALLHDFHASLGISLTPRKSTCCAGVVVWGAACARPARPACVAEPRRRAVLFRSAAVSGPG